MTQVDAMINRAIRHFLLNIAYHISRSKDSTLINCSVSKEEVLFKWSHKSEKVNIILAYNLKIMSMICTHLKMNENP